MTVKQQLDAPIIANKRLQGSYYQIDLECPSIAQQAEPGQFVHIRVTDLSDRVLRRPFSVYNVCPREGTISIIYKIVGRGTDCLSRQSPPDVLNLIGPLGRGFTLPSKEETPVISAGGYGCAATYLLAERCPRPPICLLGGRTAEDLLLVDNYRRLGATVKLATEDGSAGHQGMVTDLLEQTLAEENKEKLKLYACGPTGMLQAVCDLTRSHNLTAEVSLDHLMCCGVGACFACVVKIKTQEEPGWRYARTCTEGPVFSSEQMV